MKRLLKIVAAAILSASAVLLAVRRYSSQLFSSDLAPLSLFQLFQKQNAAALDRSGSSVCQWAAVLLFLVAVIAAFAARWMFLSRVFFGITVNKPSRPVFLSFVLLLAADIIFILLIPLCDLKFFFQGSGFSYVRLRPFLILFLPAAADLLAVLSMIFGKKIRIFACVCGAIYSLFVILDSTLLFNVFDFGMGIWAFVIHLCGMTCFVGYIYYWIEVLRGKDPEKCRLLSSENGTDAKPDGSE